MVQITEQQMLSLCRFNRGFAVVTLTLTQLQSQDMDGSIQVDALLKHDIRKRFVLNAKGALVKNGQVQAQQ
jgi:hypothetical protein